MPSPACRPPQPPYLMFFDWKREQTHLHILVHCLHSRQLKPCQSIAFISLSFSLSHSFSLSLSLTPSSSSAIPSSFTADDAGSSNVPLNHTHNTMKNIRDSSPSLPLHTQPFFYLSLSLSYPSLCLSSKSKHLQPIPLSHPPHPLPPSSPHSPFR